MKRLIILNLIIWLIIYIIPAINKNINLNFYEDMLYFKIEKENLNQEISSRSDIRNTSELHVSENCLNQLKNLERF